MSGAPNTHPRERLSEYLDDALEIEVRQSVDRHLADCADCRAELAALRHLVGAIAAEDVPPVPAALAARVGRRVDEATLARPRFRRFLVPASIAATIGAIGLLVVLQWRQGRIGLQPAPDVSRPVEQIGALEERKSLDAPATSTAADGTPPAQVELAPEKEGAPSDALGKDLGRNEQSELDEKQNVKKAEAAPVGFAVGGADRQRAAADDARRDTGTSNLQVETAAAAPKPSAPFAPAAEAPVLKAKTDRDTSCAERWSDSGVRGSWGVPDIYGAERQLGRIAHAVGGIGLWRGVADGRPYIVVVPRAHFEEVFYALRARGVAGLQDPPTLPEGSDCTGISVSLVLTPDTGAPAAPER